MVLRSRVEIFVRVLSRLHDLAPTMHEKLHSPRYMFERPSPPRTAPSPAPTPHSLYLYFLQLQQYRRHQREHHGRIALYDRVMTVHAELVPGDLLLPTGATIRAVGHRG